MKTWEEMRSTVSAREEDLERRVLRDIEAGVAAGLPFAVKRDAYGPTNLHIWEKVVLELRAGGFRVRETDDAVTVEERSESGDHH